MPRNGSRQHRSARGVAAGVIGQEPMPVPELKRLDVFIGQWINERYTVETSGAPSLKITTSDVYEWMPGEFFVRHTAFGRIGEPAARELVPLASLSGAVVGVSLPVRRPAGQAGRNVSRWRSSPLAGWLLHK